MAQAEFKFLRTVDCGINSTYGEADHVHSAITCGRIQEEKAEKRDKTENGEREQKTEKHRHCTIRRTSAYYNTFCMNKQIGQ